MKKEKLLDDSNENSATYNHGSKSKGISRRGFIKVGTIISAAMTLPFQAATSISNIVDPSIVPIKNDIGAFRGMMPIMATPVDDNYKVDMVSQRRHVDYCIQTGAVAIGHFAHASEFKKIN